MVPQLRPDPVVMTFAAAKPRPPAIGRDQGNQNEVGLEGAQRMVSYLPLAHIAERVLGLYGPQMTGTHAHAIGLNTRILGGVLLGLLALTVVTSLQAMGIILVVAMLIIPGASAFLLTRRFGRMLAVAAGLGAASAVVGIYASYYANLSTGASVVLAQSAFFALAYLFGPRQGVVSSALRRRSAAWA